MNLSKIDTRFGHPLWSCGLGFSNKMQLVTIVPDQLGAPRIKLQLQAKHQAFTSSSHRENQSLVLRMITDGLPRPVEREELLLHVWIFEPFLRSRVVSPPFSSRLHVG